MSRDAMNGVTLSVVVPVYGCAPCLDVLYHRVFAALDQLQVTAELVLVDDCGPDDAWPIIARLAQADPRVRGIRLSRNFGQHAAITAGLDQARGTWCIVMDCDLQDPPEDIPEISFEISIVLSHHLPVAVTSRVDPLLATVTKLFRQLPGEVKSIKSLSPLSPRSPVDVTELSW